MTLTESATTLALDRIDLPANVRDLDSPRVDAARRVDRPRGLIVPLVVRPAGTPDRSVPDAAEGAGPRRCTAERRGNGTSPRASARRLADPAARLRPRNPSPSAC